MIKTFTLASIAFTCISFLAIAQNDETSQFTRETLPEINTEYLEARPLISGDGKTLFFVRRSYPDNYSGVKDDQDIYVATYDETTDTWSTPQNIGKVLNNRRNNAIASVNEDGTEGVFFNTYRKTRKAPLARSKRTDRGWSTPTPVTIQGFVNLNDYADYHHAFKQNVLISAIEGERSFGGQDLYISFPDGFGGWKEPVNLGAVLNTKQSEFAPFLGSDGRSLFFCSYGHNSAGGSDIFMSVRLDDSWMRWSKPVSLGSFVNTSQEESFFSITDDFKYLYYTSYTTRQTNRDIYRIRLPEEFTAINGPVLAQLDSVAISNIMLSGNYRVSQKGATKNFQGVSFEGWPEEEEEALAEANLETTAPAENNISEAGSTINPTAITGEGNPATAASGTYSNAGSTAVPEGESARFAGFQPADEVKLSPEADELMRTLRQQLPDLNFLVREQNGVTEFKIVQNLEYDFNAVYVAPDYLPRLRRLGNILRDRNDLTVTLYGHTDEIGAQDVNQRVAVQRVENLENYFKRRGITADRIEVVGVGNTEPLNANDTDGNRQKNRRVETVLRLAQQ
ncbi:OmpA/MotB domain-containing protein [Flammeovirgaceae bacterium 311]|nr:OmpA/MotB domain-containing protein [Flammeovirgaceae bacterium 311]